jgi:glycosyltransferase involved in cell wall biosynthesis
MMIGNHSRFTLGRASIADAELPARQFVQEMSPPSRGGQELPPGGVGASKVLLWHWGGRGGAGSKFTFELARGLSRVPTIAPFLSAPEGSELESLGRMLPDVPMWTVRTFAGNGFAKRWAAVRAVMELPILARRFQEIVNEVAPDVALCTFQSIWDLATLMTLRRKERRFLLILHDARVHPGDWYPFRETIARQIVAAADGLIVLSEHVGREAERCHDFPSERIWIVPHGVFSYGSQTVVPRSFPRGRPVRLLFFGRIQQYKGLGLLLDAFRELCSRGIELELEIVGSGNLAPYAAQLDGLANVAILNKWVSDEEIAGALARCDVVVLPYIEASQSGVATAALGAAIPVVATPVGGLVEQVEDGRTGVLANAVNSHELANAIERLSERPEFYESCSAGALDYARRLLSWEGIAAEIGKVVLEIGVRPRRRGQR